MNFRDHINSFQFDTEAGIASTIFYWRGCPFLIDFEIDFLGITDHINPLHNKLEDVTEKKYHNCGQHGNRGILWDTCK